MSNFVKNVTDQKRMQAIRKHQKEHTPKGLMVSATLVFFCIIAAIIILGLCIFGITPWSSLWYPVIGIGIAFIIALIVTFLDLQKNNLLDVQQIKQEEMQKADEKVEEILKKLNLQEKKK